MKKVNAGFQLHSFSLLLFLSVFVIVSNSSAEDKTAASCSADDIQSAIDSCLATGGGTVTIPACDAFGTWQSGDRIIATAHAGTDLRVLGQGPDKTKIGYAAGQQGNGGMFWFRGPGLREFGKMHLKGDGYADASGRMCMRLHGIENARIHHIITEDFTGPTGSICAGKNNVIDHCYFGTVLYGGTYIWYVFGDNTYPADWTPHYGSDNYNAFFEDNVFKNSHHPISLFTSGTAVVRNNTFSFPISNYLYSNLIDCHSCCYGDCGGDDEPYNWDTDVDRGGRAYEIYNNKFEWTGSGKKSYFARIRAGSVLFTGNDISATHPDGWIQQAIQLVCENNNNGRMCTSENGFPVDHSYSRGCLGATDGCCDKVTGSYIWGNTLNNVDQEVTTSSRCGDGAIAKDVDYFNRAPSLELNDGFEWTPYPYPHPLVDGSTGPTPDPGNDPTPDPGDDPGNNQDDVSDPNTESNSGCFIRMMHQLKSLLPLRFLTDRL